MQGSQVNSVRTSAQADADALVLWQVERLFQVLPLLCLAIIASVVAMATAVLGDLPWWQQLFPPLIIGLTLAAVLAWRAVGRTPADPDTARRILRNTTGIAGALGLVAGVWGVNAFSEMEEYYCMTAPVFLGLAALISASCLLSVPRAAIAAMVFTTAPLIVKLALFPNLGIRAMAAMTVFLTIMQAWIVITNFRQSRDALKLRRELHRTAHTDPLTGLANRRAFEDKVATIAEDGRPLAVAMLDLNGFKAANDEYGHFVGDCLLAETARRLEQVAPEAFHARLGGDEFALAVPDWSDREQFAALLDSIDEAIARPYVFAEGTVVVSIAIGGAIGPEDGTEPEDLLRIADRRLYAHKRSAKSGSRRRAA